MDAMGLLPMLFLVLFYVVRIERRLSDLEDRADAEPEREYGSLWAKRRR